MFPLCAYSLNFLAYSSSGVMDGCFAASLSSSALLVASFSFFSETSLLSLVAILLLNVMVFQKPFLDFPVVPAPVFGAVALGLGGVNFTFPARFAAANIFIFSFSSFSLSFCFSFSFFSISRCSLRISISANRSASLNAFCIANCFLRSSLALSDS